jgi:NADH-quinone oxidoreductase subunit K
MGNFENITQFLKEFPLKYFGLSSFLFVLALLILILNKTNFIKILVAFELMVLSIILNFNLFSTILNDDEGFVFVFIILAVAAAEASIGLAIFLTYFRNTRETDLNKIDSLKG